MITYTASILSMFYQIPNSVSCKRTYIQVVAWMSANTNHNLQTTFVQPYTCNLPTSPFGSFFDATWISQAKCYNPFCYTTVVLNVVSFTNKMQMCVFMDHISWWILLVDLDSLDVSAFPHLMLTIGKYGSPLESLLGLLIIHFYMITVLNK